MKFSIKKANEFIENNKHNVNPKYRHKFHLMPEVGWMNDPNGFIFYNGHYHLFFQYYPYEPKWGPMHWGHAKSKDLIRWTHLPVALAPDLEHETGCFSGGSIEYNKELLLMYTSHFEGNYKLEEQSIARSVDEVNFIKNGKPVITIDDLPTNASKIDFRDPNPVIIDGKIFILIGSQTLDNKGQILVYTTKDFKTFSYLNSIKHPLFGEIAECPDLFDLDGKHVLLFSATNLKQNNNSFKNTNSSLYAVGHFNTITGEYTFEHISEIDAGHHYYAPQTAFDENRVAIAWMEMWHKPYYTAQINHLWTGSMTLPRVLNVRNNRLYQTPLNINEYVKNIKNISLVDTTKTLKYFILEGQVNKNDITTITIGHESDFVELLITPEKIILDTSKTKLFPLEKRSINHNLTLVDFQLVMDNSSLELFVKDVDKTITTRVYFETDYVNITHRGNNIEKLFLKELNI